MNRLIVFFFGLYIVTSLQAQKYWDSSRPNHRITIGLRGGVNFSKQYNMEDGADNEFRMGFIGGISLDVNLVRSLSVNSGVYFSQKGYETTYSDTRGYINKKNNASFFHIPLSLSYRVELSDASQFQLNIGPYFAIGLTGNLRVNNTFENGRSYEISCFDEFEGMKKYDTGLSAGIAFVFSNLHLGINYEHGLINSSNTVDGFYNGCISIVLGYNLN